MNPVVVTLAMNIATFFASIGVSAYMRGRRDGVIETDIEYLKRDMASLMRYFKLTPAEDQNGRKRR